MTSRKLAVVENVGFVLGTLFSAAVVFDFWWAAYAEDGTISDGDLHALLATGCGFLFVCVVIGVILSWKIGPKAPYVRPEERPVLDYRIQTNGGRVAFVVATSVVLGAAAYWLWLGSVEEHGGVPTHGDEVSGAVLFAMWAGMTVLFAVSAVRGARQMRKERLARTEQASRAPPSTERTELELGGVGIASGGSSWQGWNPRGLANWAFWVALASNTMGWLAARNDPRIGQSHGIRTMNLALGAMVSFLFALSARRELWDRGDHPNQVREDRGPS